MTEKELTKYYFSTLMTVIYKDITCEGDLVKDIRYSEPQSVEPGKEYKIQVFGKEGIEFKIKVIVVCTW